MINNTREPEDSPFRVHSKVEIVALLNRLQDKNQQLTIKSDNGLDSILSVILDINDARNEIIIDASKSQTTNENITRSSRLFVEALYNNIRITFETKNARLIDYSGHTALIIAIPASLVRLQRREAFRVNTPILQPLHCTFELDIEDNQTRKFATVLKDISIGGVGLVDENCLIEVSIGQKCTHCILQLSNTVNVEVDLEIRDVRDVKLTSGKVVRKLGCSFINLSNRTEAVIQRLIMQLERNQNAKNSGLM